MADIPIPVESKSIFDPDAKRKITIEKVVQTATDVGGFQAVYDVVSENLAEERKKLALEAREKDRVTTVAKPQVAEKPKKWWQR